MHGFGQALIMPYGTDVLLAAVYTADYIFTATNHLRPLFRITKDRCGGHDDCALAAFKEITGAQSARILKTAEWRGKPAPRLIYVGDREEHLILKLKGFV